MRAAPALRNQLKNLVRTALRTGGLELVRCLDFLERRRLVLLGELEIDVLVDVGANDGYWANAVRDRGFQGRILSLEPASQPFEILQRRAEQDPAWECRRVALSDVDARERLNITAKSYSSSLLPLSPKFEGLDESLVETGTEIVDTRRLDSIVDELVQPGDRLFLKIDVQGS